MLGQFPIYPTIPAHDYERAKRWYEEKLGLVPLFEMGEDAGVFSSGGVSFMLYQTQFAGTAENTAATFVVDDVDAVVASLREVGVVFEEYAMGESGPNTVDGIDRDSGGGSGAWFKDSEGNILAIAQPPAGMEVPGPGG